MMLGANNYTVSDALTYQMFYGHFKEAINSQGTLGSRICHAGLAALELFPIVGQIVALFELAVVKTLGLAKGCCCKDLKDNKIENPKDSISGADSIPAIPGKYVLYALAFMVIAPVAIYAIASRYIPAELLQEPKDIAQNVPGSWFETTDFSLANIYATLTGYLPRTVEKVVENTDTVKEVVTETAKNILTETGNIPTSLPVFGPEPINIFKPVFNIENPALNVLTNTSV